MIPGSYKCKRYNDKNALCSLPEPMHYTPGYFGFQNIYGDGLGVSICIIDTGAPTGKHFRIPIRNCIDFTNTSVYDTHGHSTGVSGILVAQSRNNINGIVKQSNVFYAKALDDSGRGDHGSVQSAILYAIVKSVDIIVMSFGSPTHHSALQDAIKKAYDQNICVFASSGNANTQSKDADFPARLREVMSVGICDPGSPNQIGDTSAPALDIPVKSLYTTYLNNKFIEMGGSSIAAPIAAGAAACLIQYQKARKAKYTPSDIYESLMKSIAY